MQFPTVYQFELRVSALTKYRSERGN